MSTSNSPQIAHINKPVFYVASAIIFTLVFVSALWPETANSLFKQTLSSILKYGSWYYVSVVAAIFISVIFFSVSRYGDIKLGPDHSEPDYSYTSWMAMLFSAGMGIGIMFFGVAEPVMHYLNPPNAEGETIDAAREAMKITFFHWGLHAWSIYAVVGLILAYFSFRQKLPLTLRSALYPLIGDKIYGPIGHAIDIFAILGTVFGVATSLGLGVAQINAGLAHSFGLTESINVQVVIIVLVTGLALISVLSGLDKGIKRLSEANLSLAVVMAIVVLILGPTLFLVQSLVENTGAYLAEIVSKTFNLYTYKPTDWLGGWTIFYWGWWISWSPFVGIFIARISRGRTIREFCLGVTLVPTAVTLVWLTVFGNSAIDLIMNQGQQALAEAVNANAAVALFEFYTYFPLSSLLSVLGVLMVVIFFVTSADSGALVVNMLASGGNDNTPAWQRIYWTCTMGVVAIILLLAGGLSALQSAAIATALPFSLILIFAIYGLSRALRVENIKRTSLLDSMNTTPIATNGSAETCWKERLRNLSHVHESSHVEDFIHDTAVSSLRILAEEFRRQGLEVDFNHREDVLQLTVGARGENEFVYCVRSRRLDSAAFPHNETDGDATDSEHFRAEVFLKEGGKDYDVMGYTQDQLINDVLDQYEKHLHFLARLN